ncbi:hypothetical protein CMO93_03520 [Candidatus Woesearchaeota archaeon]|nr:hypothetical protein [Candidatus Woesearchaeota archaeon]|tara:strand:- start:2050 stop:2352 length:303 start_codon:yes stop_codon:yes gene_type:complete
MSEKAYKIFFGTLNNKNRLKIINLLRKGTKCVHDISAELKFNQTTVSHNLKRLLHCGFVFVENKGKHRYYSLNKKTIKPLMGLIDRHMHHFCEKIAKGER